jgi:hypothetical protein
MASISCPTCQTPVPAGAAFCPNCGTRMAQPSSAGSPTVLINPPLVEPNSSEPAPPSYTPQTYTPPAYSPPAQQLPPGEYYAPPSLPTSTAAIVSLISGILAWTILPIIGTIVAIVAGHMARNEIGRSNGQVGGGGFAVAGLILGYASLVVIVLGICALVAIFGLALLGASASG